MRYALGFALSLLGLLGVPATSQGAQSTIALSPSQLQAGLNEHFPLRRCLLELACLTLAEPRVRLINGDPRIYLSVVAVPELSGSRMREGRVEANGEPRYAPAEGAFYVDRPDLTRLEFPDLSESQRGFIVEASRLLLAEMLARVPVWRLDEQDARQAFAKLVLRDIEVRNGRLLLKVGDEDDSAPYGDERDDAEIGTEPVPRLENNPRKGG